MKKLAIIALMLVCSSAFATAPVVTGKVSSATVTSSGLITIKVRTLTTGGSVIWNAGTLSRVQLWLQLKASTYSNYESGDTVPFWWGMVSPRNGRVKYYVQRNSLASAGTTPDSTDNIFLFQIESQDVSAYLSEETPMRYAIRGISGTSALGFTDATTRTIFGEIQPITFTPGANMDMVAQDGTIYILFAHETVNNTMTSATEGHYKLKVEYYDDVALGWVPLIDAMTSTEWSGLMFPCMFFAMASTNNFSTMDTDGQTRITFEDEDGNQGGPFTGPNISGLAGIP